MNSLIRRFLVEGELVVEVPRDFAKLILPKLAIAVRRVRVSKVRRLVYLLVLSVILQK